MIEEDSRTVHPKPSQLCITLVVAMPVPPKANYKRDPTTERLDEYDLMLATTVTSCSL